MQQEKKIYYGVYRSNSRGRAYIFCLDKTKHAIQPLALARYLPVANGQYIYAEGEYKNKYLNVERFLICKFPRRASLRQRCRRRPYMYIKDSIKHTTEFFA